MSSEAPKPNKSENFVESTIRQCLDNNGLAAALKRADNPATEYQSWEYLAGFSIPIDIESQRLPYATIAAAIARAKAEHNGKVGIGRAIALCYEDGNNSDQAKAKLRRLLACEKLDEVCRILRPLFSLIDAKAGVTLNYARLLSNLLYFEKDSQTIKSRWAQDFYYHVQEDKEAI
jgi:CRISPR system Cascade subunit CasB